MIVYFFNTKFMYIIEIIVNYNTTMSWFILNSWVKGLKGDTIYCFISGNHVFSFGGVLVVYRYGSSDR